MKKSPSCCTNLEPSILKEISPGCSLEGLIVEPETLVPWPPDAKSWLLKRSWCWERLRVGGEGDNRGWDGWMASPTQWIWVWVGSESWWWTRRPGMMQFMGLQRVGHDWATELNWGHLKLFRLQSHSSSKTQVPKIELYTTSDCVPGNFTGKSKLNQNKLKT